MTRNGADAVVYDLDGTLVDLAVDWDAATADVRDLFERNGRDADGATLWELLERADAAGLRAAVESVIGGHERDGAHQSTRLAHADELPDAATPVGVVSLNCEAACRVALERHSLVEHVDVVVGRDTVETYKPDPEPLLAALADLGVEPGDAVFVGDSARDETTAERAGVAFEWV